MKLKFILVVVFIFSSPAFSLNFKGEILFKNELNAPGFSLEAKCSDFDQFEFSWKEEKKLISLQHLKVALKTECLKKGLSLQNKYIEAQQIDLTSLKIKGAKDGIVTLDSKQIPCTMKKKNIFICTGNADILFEDKKSLVPVILTITKLGPKLLAESSFDLSLKKMGVEAPHYMGMEAQDTIRVRLSVAESKGHASKFNK